MGSAKMQRTSKREGMQRTIIILLGIAIAAATGGSEDTGEADLLSRRFHGHRGRHGHGHGGSRQPQPPAPPAPTPPEPQPPVPACCRVCRNCTQCHLEPDGPFGQPAPRQSSSGGFGSPPTTPARGSGGGLECVAPMAGLMVCGTFLTGSEAETPSPQGDCCTALRSFLNSAAAAGGGGDRTLRCLCPVILGDVNKMLSKPVDPVRMMFLPIACGVVLPPNLLRLCFAGQQTHVWEKPSADAALSP